MMDERNWIDKLNNYTRKTRSELHYEDLGSVGPEHDKTFTQRAVLNGIVYPEGVGKTKKEAKRNAAKNALQCLLEIKPQDSTENAAEASTAPFLQKHEAAKLDHETGDGKHISSSQQEEEFNHNVFDRTKLWSVRTTDEGFTEAAFTKMVMDREVSDRSTAQSAAWESTDYLSQGSPMDTRSSGFFTDPSFNWEIQGSFGKESVGSNLNERFTKSSDNLGKFASEFDRIEGLGSGAFGCVHKARHKELDKYYAVKIVRWAEKSLREVGALSDLLHRNIVRYYTFWTQDSGYQWDLLVGSSSSSKSSISISSTKYLYIQMELCDTKTLRVWIDEKNTQRASKRREVALTFAQQIVSGVEYIHSKNLIHRDLKPANIMFGQDGEVKIGDFGLVTAENDDDAETPIVRTAYKGTPSYMAPEQKNQMTYDHKVDIFAVGLIFFELFWKISSIHERQTVWTKIRTQNFPERFTRNFAQEYIIIRSMLCAKPEQRPEASKLRTELEECTSRLKTQQDIGSRSY
ncbi:interferon-induced, double-stranded RNA-activated protein kinase-like isoform X2 [Pagrus major]|uniref:interferon-induced, double-stranded RNA-activated protein kinase-like isoform X2 n=1 Tax=Pagrus major TaxID=143350 RepID=UPI003CC840B4